MCAAFIGSHDHDLDLYRAAAAGEVPERELRRHRRRLLDGLCAECAHRSRFYAIFLRDRARSHPETRGRCYAAAASGWVDLAEVFAQDLPEVERELDILRSIAPKRWLPRIRRSSPPGFRSPLLAKALIEEARGRLRHDAQEALGCLRAARAVVCRAEGDLNGRAGHAPLRDLRLRIRGHEANARRVLGDLHAAEEAFAELRRRVAADPPAIAVSAELASFEASLRYDFRRLPDAEALLDRAARFYRWANDRAGLAKVLIQRGLILNIVGAAERAVSLYERALAALDREAEPQLAFNALHNLALALCAAGRAEDAHDALERAKAVYPRLGDPTNRIHILWAEGWVAAGLGRDETALEQLGAALEAYRQRGLELDAALVGLDLAQVHLGRGETGEVKRLAERMARALADRGVDPEAARAIAMFAKAALAEAVTVELIVRTRTALLHANGRGACQG